MIGWFVFFAIPVARNLFFFAGDRLRPFAALNACAGRCELFLGIWRDLFIFAASLFLLIRQSVWQIQSKQFVGWEVQAVNLLLIGWVVYSRWWRWQGLKPLAIFMHRHPTVDPREFYQHLYSCFGFLPHTFPKNPKKTFDPHHLDFSSGASGKQSFGRMLHIGYDMAMMSGLAYHSFKWFKPKEAIECANVCGLQWGARAAQLARALVMIEKASEEARTPRGRYVVVFNHKSFFDFAFAPLALFDPAHKSMSGWVPRFFVAKDHFMDNFVLGRLMHLGPLMRQWEMIFVDRKSKDPNRGKVVIRDAVRRLVRDPIPIAIYPQGTRAYGQRDRFGKRWDAGYFCVGKKDRMKRDKSHLKNGVATLAMAMVHAGREISVWPIGVEGTGTACPRNSLRVQTGVTIRFRLGEPIAVSNQDTPEQLMNRVDQSLQKLTDVQTRLERRFLTDLREVVDAHFWEEVAVSLNAWRGQDDFLYLLLDYLYACPQKYWRPFLHELAQLLRDHPATRESYFSLRDRIVAHIS